jgi:NADPH2:quinone reductase
MKAIQVNQHGGPEVLTYADIPTPKPGRSEIKIRNRAIGLNFVDVYFRTGLYNPGTLPFIPGNEGAGEVIEVGEDVKDFKPGDRVAYVVVLGAYAEESIVPVPYVVHLPESIQYEMAAAVMLKGLTAQYLLRQTFPVKSGQTILIHAAAGGVGQIVTQWAKHLGATVIGTVGTAKKAAIAQKNGCDYVINYSEENIAEKVKEFTDGKGCHVVYDSVGQATLVDSLDSLRPRGYFVSFGSASGPVENFDLTMLNKRGSLFATSPTLFDYVDEINTMSAELFELIDSGIINISSPAKVPLADAAKAHAVLEARQTSGATILLP